MRFELMPGNELDRLQPETGKSIARTRRVALARLRDGVQESVGPILVTGEPGSGKTWLTRALAAALDGAWMTRTVRLGTEQDGVAIWTDLAARLGHPGASGVGEERRVVEEILSEEAAEGRRLCLVVEHLEWATDRALESLGVLSETIGETGGLGALVLVGLTESVRRLSARPWRVLASRLSQHVHLGPLDFDEMLELLEIENLADPAERARLQVVHRWARGNPRAILHREHPRTRAVISAPASPAPAPTRLTSPAPAGSISPAPAPAPARPILVQQDRNPSDLGTAGQQAASERPAAPLLPSRPPIRVEEGLVEVGWDGDLDGDGEDAVSTASEQPAVRPRPGLGDEPVVDQYAAIQAFTEWSRNQDFARGSRASSSSEIDSDFDEALQEESLHEAMDLEESPEDESEQVAAHGQEGEPGRMARSTHRGEPRHALAPPSHLFGATRRG